ncbi:hypothetical protein A3754_13400 [Alcanivorax sp. HI0083]|uniref:hypothetical protein n=1 Tax=unclassified Alcanivorax TaxID=2638842 RepID=UPI0007B8F51B|nr:MULTISPECIES: hypothetical protein [unclassified Alcanivorax]KZY31535.1 hypothetical protein A3730_19325 [Alcanivorax sp. HI0044]KZY34017.1 hypothetical protein A3730_03520 [Alcanivorax sp. HI0044]KZZ25735.1 hypothetical protein A3754_13400 [Alcanivorax sp. HI0083]
MSHLHIDDFTHDVARILMQSYMSFPRPGALYVEDIIGPTEVDDVGLHSTRHMSCLGAMLWLAEEGYLRYQATIFQEGLEQAVLSNRAFVLLTALSDLRFAETDPQLPASVQLEKATVAEQLLQAIRAQDSARTTALVRYLLSRNPQPVDKDEFAPLGAK